MGAVSWREVVLGSGCCLKVVSGFDAVAILISFSLFVGIARSQP